MHVASKSELILKELTVMQSLLAKQAKVRCKQGSCGGRPAVEAAMSGMARYRKAEGSGNEGVDEIVSRSRASLGITHVIHSWLLTRLSIPSAQEVHGLHEESPALPATMWIIDALAVSGCCHSCNR